MSNTEKVIKSLCLQRSIVWKGLVVHCIVARINIFHQVSLPRDATIEWHNEVVVEGGSLSWELGWAGNASDKVQFKFPTD